MKTIFLFFQNFNPNKRDYATPYDSTQGMTLEMQLVFFGLVFIFGLYVVFRVRQQINEDNAKK